MRTAAANAFVDFTQPLEGYTPYLYTDQKGYVTTGLGDLVEDLSTHTPTANVFTLPWTHGDGGAPASRDEIQAAWDTVKNAFPGVQSTASQNLTDLRLSKDAVLQLALSKVAEMEQTLRSRYPNYDSWPADAQLGIVSMSWAMGPAFHYPAFAAAVNADPPDFATAAAQSAISGAYYDKRNAANVLLFQNADKVQRGGGDPDTLWWPNTAPDDGGSSSGDGGIPQTFGLVVATVALVGAGWATWHFFGPRIQGLFANLSHHTPHLGGAG